MKAQWGISYMSGEPVFKRLPPEMVYGLRSMSPEQNANWIKKEIIEEADRITDETGERKYDLQGREITMMVHPRYTNNGRPTYQVFYTDDVGAIHHIPELDGAVPNWRSSQEARTHQAKMELEAARKREEDRMETREALEKRKVDAKRLEMLKGAESGRRGGGVISGIGVVR
jgi:hypothetical protein